MPRPVDPARAAAQESGARFYTSARACRTGHEPRRYTSTGACVACVRLQKAPPAPAPSI